MQPLLTLFTVFGLLVVSVKGLQSNPTADGKYTYCWHIDQPPSVSELSKSDKLSAHEGDDCPMIMTVELSNDTMYAFDSVKVKWTVQADFDPSKELHQTKLSYGKDSKGRVAQIVHSNIHSCIFGTGCDPFEDGEELEDKTSNKVANMTSDGSDFEDVLLYTNPGHYSVLAHIITPDAENKSRQYAYAVYAKLLVKPRSVKPSETTPDSTGSATVDTAEEEDDSGLSTGALAGIIVACVVAVAALVVAVFVLRRRKRSDPNNNYVPPPSYDEAMQGSSKDGGYGYPSARTVNTNSSAFQSAWGGPGQGPYNTDDSANSNSMASSNILNSNHAKLGQSFGTYSEASGGVRKSDRPKRTDSDIEL